MSHYYGAAKGRSLADTVQKAVGLLEKHEMPKATQRPASKRFTPSRRPDPRPAGPPRSDG